MLFSYSETADSSLSTRLTQIYSELEAIEADKAPAKAGVILSGLGFASDGQQRPTRFVNFLYYLYASLMCKSLANSLCCITLVLTALTLPVTSFILVFVLLFW